ncbi:maleylpyruvate isomerase family mycothiol-dependent enzyme [Arthrobacter sp. NamB2]|uniref:maleylpyruvate isomerase family mycothiol-dependent enzyme n=1 Tax=Arthrobacter sp. NamB2 TaxID=2576035 RepID=UPI0010C952C7|nr:maleylpyruvate isomerase family mycothiol-dependent enzyme [Arthrobacter sp. NamB2]TKV28475.1 maleylpyruvate isomerase family mycothiol-dependent enzyme [Arthrobacter sp. NamB2]
MQPDEIAVAVRAERQHLCGFLETLDDAEWTAPSLCSAWTVREVVAHLTIPTRASVGFLVVAAIRARGNFHRMIADTARIRAARFTAAELVQQLRESAESSRRIPGSAPMDPLTDLLVHGQDIAQALGRAYRVRLDVAVPVLTYVVGNRMLGAPERLLGLELVATDAEWSSGEGLRVEGSVKDLLLVAAGRPVGLARLTGPGVERLAGRLDGR